MARVTQRALKKRFPFESGPHIKKLRLARDLSQRELSALSGINHSTIALYETGRSSPLYRNVRRLSLAMDCTVGEVMGESPVLQVS